jgi:hypothetical protein
MTDPTHTVVHVDVPKVSNVIEVGELLRALSDFAARQAASTLPPPPGAASLAADPGRVQDLARVRDLATQLAELVERIPDLPRSRPPAPPQA